MGYLLALAYLSFWLQLTSTGTKEKSGVVFEENNPNILDCGKGESRLLLHGEQIYQGKPFVLNGITCKSSLHQIVGFPVLSLKGVEIYREMMSLCIVRTCVSCIVRTYSIVRTYNTAAKNRNERKLWTATDYIHITIRVIDYLQCDKQARKIRSKWGRCSHYWSWRGEDMFTFIKELFGRIHTQCVSDLIVTTLSTC